MKLVPLEIPMGWEMKKNHFFDVKPVVQEGAKRLEYPFHEDILWARNELFGFSIDLGWYPDSDPNGAYTLLLLRLNDNTLKNVKQSLIKKINGNQQIRYVLKTEFSEDWNKPIESFTSRDLNAIREKLNAFLSKPADLFSDKKKSL